jgi:hypothetical protein
MRKHFLSRLEVGGGEGWPHGFPPIFRGRGASTALYGFVWIGE